MVIPSWVNVDEFVYVAVQHNTLFCAVQHFCCAAPKRPRGIAIQ